jgi:hypothetical protein
VHANLVEVGAYPAGFDAYPSEVDGYSGEMDGYSGEVDGYSGEADGYSGEMDGYSGEVDGYSGEVDALLVWGNAISLEVDALLVWGNANSSGETPTSAGPGQDIADTLLWACCQAGPSDGARCVDLTQPRCYFAPLSAVFVAAVLYASGRSASRAREGVSAIGRF